MEVLNKYYNIILVRVDMYVNKKKIVIVKMLGFLSCFVKMILI